ncbi:DUF4190 domain-containing protein [Amycolatopsis australiensis]|uniref:DUF4190 domain-containing protein n=1 Tax=Amycolatopsis australiensis TaxID=546364 RepID=A0A1K1T8A5_9PSEU|nr:DUF4190 domain-containing protein [Amycolatopsis australiensis]SFW92599.1 protein of unknown function [Amycolatopsis australiensis]
MSRPRGHPGGPARPTRSAGLAFGALMCSLFGLFVSFFAAVVVIAPGHFAAMFVLFPDLIVAVAAVVVGHVARNKAKRGEAVGQGVALQAIILGYLVIALDVLLIVVANGAFR